MHGNTVYLRGQVPADFSTPLKEQVESTLAKVDALLLETGSGKDKLLSAQIWIKDMADFKAMNDIWCDWLECKPARACVQAPMAHPDILFEVMIVAAKN